MNPDEQFWPILCTWFLYFLFYSIAGYLLEIIHTARSRQVFENRGFLFGPYCPIYGFGALILIASTMHFSVNPFMVFFMAVVVCTALEYVTAVLMENIFHMRWWDYSAYPLNFQGRICLRNSILFGLGGLAIIYITQPSVIGIIASIPQPWLYVIASVSAIIMLIDFIMSAIANYNIRELISDMKGEVTTKNIKHAAFDYYLHHKRVISELKKRAKQKFRY